MKLKVVLGIIGIALICVGLVAVGGETGCQPEEEAVEENLDLPRYTTAQVITIVENYLQTTGRGLGLPEECRGYGYRSSLRASYKGHGIWEITAICSRSAYSRSREGTTFIFDEKTGALH